MARRSIAVVSKHKKICLEMPAAAHELLGIVCDVRYADTANRQSFGSLAAEAILAYYADYLKKVPAKLKRKKRPSSESRRLLAKSA